MCLYIESTIYLHQKEHRLSILSKKAKALEHPFDHNTRGFWVIFLRNEGTFR